MANQIDSGEDDLTRHQEINVTLFTVGFTESQGARIGRWAAAAVLAFGLHAGGATVALMHWQQDAEADAVAGAISLELAPLFAAAPMDTPDVAPGPLMQEAMLTPQASKQTEQEMLWGGRRRLWHHRRR